MLKWIGNKLGIYMSLRVLTFSIFFLFLINFIFFYVMFNRGSTVLYFNSQEVEEWYKLHLFSEEGDMRFTFDCISADPFPIIPMKIHGEYASEIEFDLENCPNGQVIIPFDEIDANWNYYGKTLINRGFVVDEDGELIMDFWREIN